jgi:hypothetical protein
MLKRKFSEHLGFVGEVYLAQILWNGQKQTFPARLLHAGQDILLPNRFFYIRHRVRLGAGAGREIDVYAAAGADVWICESKWWQDRKVGVSEIEVFIEKAALVRQFEGEGLRTLRCWFFSHSGFTEDAIGLMQEEDIFFSDREDLDDLLTSVGLRKLPTL